jgi:hypothetical protein
MAEARDAWRMELRGMMLMMMMTTTTTTTISLLLLLLLLLTMSSASFLLYCLLCGVCLGLCFLGPSSAGFCVMEEAGLFFCFRA